MEKKIHLKGSLAYVYKVLQTSLEKMGVSVEAGALDESNLVIAINYDTLAEQITENVNKNVWKLKIKDGVMYLLAPKEVIDEDIREVNEKILSKLRNMGVDAHVEISQEGDALVQVNLEDVALKILQNAIEETRKRAGDRMRRLRVEYASIENYTYILLYEKGKKIKTKEDKLKEALEKI